MCAGFILHCANVTALHVCIHWMSLHILLCRTCIAILGLLNLKIAHPIIDPLFLWWFQHLANSNPLKYSIYYSLIVKLLLNWWLGSLQRKFFPLIFGWIKLAWKLCVVLLKVLSYLFFNSCILIWLILFLL